jgi:hypothetical protein
VVNMATLGEKERMFRLVKFHVNMCVCMNSLMTLEVIGQIIIIIIIIIVLNQR